MNLSDISYFRIADVFITAAAMRVGLSVALFWMAHLFIKHTQTESTVETPWSFNAPIKLLCFFIIFEYLTGCLAVLLLKAVGNYYTTNIAIMDVRITYIVSIIYSFLIFFTILYVVKKRRVADLTGVGYRRQNLRRGTFLGLLLSIIYMGTMLILAKNAYVRRPEQYLLMAQHNINIMSLFSMVVFVPISEELFFRGFLFKTLRNKLPFVYAAGLSSLLFVIFHMHIGSRAFIIFMLGYFLAYLFSRTGSLIPGIIFHASANFFILLSEHNKGIVVQLIPWNGLLFSSAIIIPFSLVFIKKLIKDMASQKIDDSG